METNKKLFLKNFEKKVNKLFLENYLDYFDQNYEIQLIENVMSNGSCHFVATFKDFLILDDFSEYLHRYYKEKESLIRLNKLYDYYHETSVIFPNYTPLKESKYLYDNVIKKQNVIDEQQDLEDYKKIKKNDEKKKNKKPSTIQKIENIFKNNGDEEDTRVFDSKVYEEIFNTSESLQRIIFGIDKKSKNNYKKSIDINDDNNNINDSKQTEDNDSIRELLLNIEKFNNIKEKNKKIISFNKSKNFEILTKLLSNKKYKSLPKENNPKKNATKDTSSQFKRNRTININININNTKNNYAITSRLNVSNIRKNKFFPISNDFFKDRILFNQKKNENKIPFQMFRCSNYISNLKANKKTINDNSSNSHHQRLIEIFTNKIKKNKHIKKNDSYNHSLGKTINISGLRAKNRVFILNTIQHSIMNLKSKKNNSKNTKSDKSLSFRNKRTKYKSSNNSLIYKINKRNNTNLSINYKKVKTQSNINSIEKYKKMMNNNNYFTLFINKPLMTFSPSFKKKNVFGLNTISRFTETIHDYKFKKRNKKDEKNSINLNQIIRNSSIKNKIINMK